MSSTIDQSTTHWKQSMDAQAESNKTIAKLEAERVEDLKRRLDEETAARLKLGAQHRDALEQIGKLERRNKLFRVAVEDQRQEVEEGAKALADVKKKSALRSWRSSITSVMSEERLTLLCKAVKNHMRKRKEYSSLRLEFKKLLEEHRDLHKTVMDIALG